MSALFAPHGACLRQPRGALRLRWRDRPVGTPCAIPKGMPTETRQHRQHLAPGTIKAQWWHALEDGRVQCDLCPRRCKLHDGQKAFCFVRQAKDGELLFTSYGRAVNYCVDPVEKKPLNHFYPGSAVLSFGTPGCNLGCRFCQNWNITKARNDSLASSEATPSEVVATAEELSCKGVAFTYNDPIVFAEYAIDCAVEAHEAGLKTIAVSNGYMEPTARKEFYAHIDAANIDLKAFSEGFYYQNCAARLRPVLDTLTWLAQETDVWLEVTTLLIPGHNDSEEEITRMCDWFIEHLGPSVPLHFTAFFPAYRMKDVERTPLSTLQRARAQAIAAGIEYVYTGNDTDPEGQSTYCPGCHDLLIGRDGYAINRYALTGAGSCPNCGRQVPGHFERECKTIHPPLVPLRHVEPVHFPK